MEVEMVIVLGAGEGRDGFTDALNVAMMMNQIRLMPGEYEVRIKKVKTVSDKVK